MSRGPGKVQQTILGILAPHTAGVALPSLAWDVAEAGGLLDGDDLPEEIYKDIHRAVQLLARPRSGLPRVVARKERIATLGELLEYYPDRTKRGKIRHLRRELLPHIRTFAGSPEGRRRIKATHVSTEDLVLYHTLQGGAARAELAAAWPNVEDAIARSLGRLDATARPLAIHLLTRGHALLLDDHVVEARVGLLDAVERLRKALGGRPARLEAELARFNGFLPARDIRRARLKGVLRAVVHLHKGDPPRMLDAFKRHLRDVAPEQIGPLCSENPAEWWDPGPKFDPILDQLVLQDALKPFDIYTLAL